MEPTYCANCDRMIVNEWPFCPHGAIESAHGVVGDDIPGGFVQENFGPEPEVFYSRKAMLKRADELGLQPFVRHAGEHEKHLTNWAAGATEKQLRDAAALLSRGAPQGRTPAVCETLETSIRELNSGVRVGVHAD